MFNNSLEHTQEINRLWLAYNKEISGSDFIGANIYENVLKYNPFFQSEIFYIMFNAGYERALKDYGIKK